MGKEIILKGKSPQFIFCYWDDYSILPIDKIKDKIKTNKLK
jgi:hypothetical protein|tara:strand:+ start:849 stop:971 length:123 start_codon:yes stop_codon:yes gene_type:complete